jgi:hypothetical protein
MGGMEFSIFEFYLPPHPPTPPPIGIYKIIFLLEGTPPYNGFFLIDFLDEFGHSEHF